MNTLYSLKLNEIQQLNEAEFTIDVVIPLFEELGYRGLRYTHGISEYGMDVVCYEISKFGLKRYVGVQVKVGNIGGTRKVQDIISQAKASFNSHYLDISSQIEYNINELYVVTTGKITEYAKNQIINSLNGFSGNIKFFDGESIVDILYKNNPEKIKLNYDNYFELFFYKLYEKYDELLGDVSDIEKDKTLSYLNSNKIKKNCIITCININNNIDVQIGSHQHISLEEGNSVIIFQDSWREDMVVRFKNYTELMDLMYAFQTKHIINIPHLFSIEGDDYRAYFLDKFIEEYDVYDLVEHIYKCQYESAELSKNNYVDKDKEFNDIPLYESEIIEFKREIPNNIQNIAKTLASFANKKGGSLYLGVDDDRFVIGIDDIDKAQLRINGIARNNCEPPLHPRYDIIDFDGKKVLKIDIEKSDKVHRIADGKYYVRVGSASLEISVDELEKLFLDRYTNRKGSLT